MKKPIFINSHNREGKEMYNHYLSKVLTVAIICGLVTVSTVGGTMAAEVKQIS